MSILVLLVVIFSLLLIVSIILAFCWGEVFFYLSVLIGLIAFFLFLQSLTSNIPLSEEHRQAEVMRTFDALVIKAPDWPEQRSTDINFLDKPVQIVESTYVNSWGTMARKEYTVEVIPVENN